MINSNLFANIVSIIALIFSFLSLVLHFRSHIKENVKLKVSQIDENEAYCFAFTRYEKYQCLFFYVDISNPSKTDVSISRTTLLDKYGNTYTPSHYDIGDTYNENGLTLHHKDEQFQAHLFNLKSENILNNLRVPSNGNICGYLVFFNVPIIDKPEKYTLKIKTPNKSFKKSIVVNPLPDNLKTMHP